MLGGGRKREGSAIGAGGGEGIGHAVVVGGFRRDRRADCRLTVIPIGDIRELRFSDAEPPPAAGSSPLITAPAVSADGAPSEGVVVVALSASLKPSSRALQRLRVVLQRRRQLLFALPTSAIDCA